MRKHEKARRFITPTRTVLVSFLLLILAGACLLTLPAATQNGESIGFINALFTATSATCVTGLAVVTTASTFNVFGQIVILLLIQVGGIGFMILACSFYALIGRKISLQSRLNLKEDFSQSGMQSLAGLTQKIVVLTAIVEGVGIIILTASFSRYYPFGRALWYGVFHAVSAYCNAGLDILALDGSGFTAFASDPFVLLPIAALIIIGGLGFIVVIDMLEHRRWRRLNFHSKVVLPVTLVLILAGTCLILGAEYNNPATLGKMDWGDKILNSFFQSVTCRTAGFNTYDMAAATPLGTASTIMLMFVGASPCSTGGGLKTTTIFILFVHVAATLRRKKEAIVDMRKISAQSVSKAASALMLAISVLIMSILLLSITEGGRFSLENLLFEQVSAYGTVGLSQGITSQLSVAGKLIIILNMYTGRIGAFSFFMAFTSAARQNTKIDYPEANITI